jgi:hypothetical protein
MLKFIIIRPVKFAMKSHNHCFLKNFLQVLLQGKMNLKINNFLEWSEFTETGIRLKSSVFEFNFPEVQKSFHFCLNVYPKGCKNEEPGKDNVGVFLRNENNAAIQLKYTLSILDQFGKKVAVENVAKLLPANHSWGFPDFVTRTFLASDSNTFLPEGHLKIHCDFTIIHSDLVSSISTSSPETSSDTLRQSMEKLLTDPTLSDFKVVCGEETVACHRNILATKSDVFGQMFSSGKWAETQKKCYKIEDFEPEVVKQMIRYVYTSELPGLGKCSSR